MQTLIILSASVIFGLLISFYNAFIYKLYFTRDKSDNKIVHRIGAGLRLFWMALIIVVCWYNKLLAGDAAFFILINITLAWTVFDLIYNWIHNHPWYYSGTLGSGTSSSLDKAMNKFDEYIKAGIIVSTILWYPFNVNEMFTDMIVNRGWQLVIAIVVFSAFGYVAYRFFNKKEK